MCVLYVPACVSVCMFFVIYVCVCSFYHNVYDVISFIMLLDNIPDFMKQTETFSIVLFHVHHSCFQLVAYAECNLCMIHFPEN